MRVYVALISLSIIWGLTFILIKMTVGDTGAWGMVFLRCLIGSLFLLPLLILKLRKRTSPIPFKHLIILGVINSGIPWGLLAWSETAINSNTTSVINALTPLFTALVGYLFFKKILLKRQWFGILTGFFGIVILTEFQIHQLLVVILLELGQWFWQPSSTLWISVFKEASSKEDLIITITLSLFVGSLVGLIIGYFTHDLPKFAAFDVQTTLIVLALGAIGSGVAHILLYYMIIHGTPEFAATVAYIIPITAIIASYLMLGEPITVNLITGMIFIFIGVYITGRYRKN